jgi:methylated-DNA-[protein]-cysteine S-methyltransferase
MRFIVRSVPLLDVAALGFAWFDTAVGRCGVSWTASGIDRVALPPAHFAGVPETEPPPAVREAIAGMVALLDGEPRDLTDVVLDLEGVAAFARSVYDATRAIPPGRTATYGDLAERIGTPGNARAVGQALGANPVPIIVPCHRVVGAGGKLVGFSAPGGTATKARLLAIETGARSLFD